MRRGGLFLFLLIYFPLVYNAKAQSISNEGTDFWAVFPTHDPSGTPGNPTPESQAKITIYITSKYESKVIVSYGNYVSEPIIIPPNVAVRFPKTDDLRDPVYIPSESSNRSLTNKGIHIQVVPGNPKVAVYAHIWAGARSAASLILPKESLGQKYYSMNYTANGDDKDGVNRNYLVLVATEPNTDLLIRDLRGTVFRVHLEKAGDVYEYMPVDKIDLTGISVEVDPASADNCTKTFAAFSGSTSTAITSADCGIGINISRDPLYQQLYPTSSWGKTYALVPFKNRKYFFRIIAQTDNTHVTVGNTSVTLLSGQCYPALDQPENQKRPFTEPLFITADQKISVAQYSLTQDCSSANGEPQFGDPEMVLLNPVEFNIKAITLFSSKKQNIFESERYINVFIKTSATNTFKIDGIPQLSGWLPMPSNPEYSYNQINLPPSPPSSDPNAPFSSILTADEGFNAIAYGFGDHESYAYSAGTNLAANNFLLIHNTVTNIDAQNACIDQPSDFKIILPYLAKKISWKLDAETPFEQDAPTPDRSFTGPGGDILYEYIYVKQQRFPTISKHNMVVTAEMPNTTNCLSSSVDYLFEFDVNPIPTVDFIADSEACSDIGVQFTDKSESHISNKPVNKWLWDFGDGTSASTQQNPTHAYNKAGTFTITLFAGLDDGCTDEITKTIAIKPKITADFTVSPVTCINGEVNFQDKSAVDPIEDGNEINSWSWDFGDGSPTSTDQNPVHTYTTANTYTASLITGTKNGCKSLPKKVDVTINPLPVANFSMPEICSEDDIAQFKNLSADANGGRGTLTYLWNFGDAGNPQNTSANINGAHKYNTPGQYNVTLTVTNSNGCINSISQNFTVNGSEVAARFDVVNADNLCSVNNVTVTNNAIVNSGKVTKVIWYPDAGKPESILDDNPEPGKSYEFTYPAAISPEPRKITIMMRAYSGIKCYDEIIQEITLYPSPVIQFDAIPSLCLNSGPTQITQAAETLGIQGTGKYSGPGITADGLFDPQAAGTGTHNIIYTFTPEYGCEESKTQTLTVNPVPAVSLTKDLNIYEGGYQKVDAVAEGTGLTYKWTPSTNLDRDDVLNPTVYADKDRTYALTITSSQGCSITETIDVHVLYDIKAPNAFSPNGDGINDFWELKYIETYPNTTVDIFNRYGMKVFSSRGYKEPFGGNYKDEPLPVGTYYYIINPNNGRKTVTGSLTLIR